MCNSSNLSLVKGVEILDVVRTLSDGLRLDSRQHEQQR
jgi:hypothetical protein